VSRTLPTRLLFIAIFGLAALAGGRAACLRWWPLAVARTGGTALPGVRVQGTRLKDGEAVRPQVDARARALKERRVRLVAGGGGVSIPVVDATLGELGVSVDVDGVTSRALGIGRIGDMWTRARFAERARRGEIDVPLQPTVEPRVIFERLLRLKEDLDVPPVPARLDLDRHAIVAERRGRALDVDGAMAALARAAADEAVADVALPFVEFAPRVTRASLASVDVSHVLGSFVTYFSRLGDQAPRAQNIEVAASHVDGLVIEPGELVSFNDVVGVRSEGNGFQKAFEIYKGEMVDGTGGGTCQVASTLHAIAFFGGLDIVQRLPHSRPSAYIPVGLDATVVYPVVDLKIRNPYPFPVVVHAEVGPNQVTMQLLGADKPAKVALMRTVLSTIPFDRKVVEDPALATPRRKQKGAEGMRLLRKRVVLLYGGEYRGGETRVEVSRDTYPPTTEIWRVPPGYDEAALPPLGEDFPNPDAPRPSAPTPPMDPEQTIWGG
jgi:vancomycin resistance protein YoaR